jgi:hypothetical protein
VTAPHPALSAIARRDQVGPVADEDALLRSAHEHRMVPSVLSAHRSGALPLSGAALLTAEIWDLAEQRTHLRLWERLHHVEGVLRELDVEACVLKGLATESRWYDRMGDRVTTDVDLFLDPRCHGRLPVIVRALDPDRGADDAIAATVARRLLQHVDVWVDGTAVDLHLDPFKLGIWARQLLAIWDDTDLLETPLGTVRVLRPEHELVLLLLHLNKDRFSLLGPFLDVRRILERGRIDLDVLRRFVAAEGLEVPVYRSLRAVALTLGMEVEIPPTSGPRVRSWERLWGPRQRLGGDQARARAPVAQRWLALHARGRTGDGLRELRRQVLPPRQLLEIAGRLDPEDHYLRAVRRPERSGRETPSARDTGAGGWGDTPRG